MVESNIYRPDQSTEIAFFIAASDQEIISQVKKLMRQDGYLGVTDTAGRVHYVVDGRKGTPYASRRILEAAGQILLDRQQSDHSVQALIHHSVDKVMARHQIRPELNGYQYLRFMLLYTGIDHTKIKPITKTLYPQVAQRFHVRVSQVERDIRYALAQTDLKRSGLTASAAFCHLQQELTHQVDAEQLALLAKKEKLSDLPETCGEPLTFH